MLLVNLSANPKVPGRRKRNEAMYHHFLRLGDELSEGIFVNPDHVDFTAGYQLLVEEHQDEPGAKRSTLLATRLTNKRGWDDFRRAGIELANRLHEDYIKGRPYFLLCNNPKSYMGCAALSLLDAATVSVYDMSDDFMTWFEDGKCRKGNLKFHLYIQDQLLRRCDRVSYVNEHLARKYPSPRFRVFTNGTEYENFQRDVGEFSLGEVIPSDGRKVVGFTGTVQRQRIDRELLRKVFIAFPEYEFLFVGYPAATDVLDFLSGFENAHFFDALPYQQLAGLLRCFDLAFIPHQVSEFTAGNDLLKVHDYLASGVPVLSTACSGIERYSEVVTIASDHESFLASLRDLVERRGGHDPAPGKAMAKRECWEQRMPELWNWMTGLDCDLPRDSRAS